MSYELRICAFQVHVYRELDVPGNYKRCKVTTSEPPSDDTTVCSFRCDCDKRMCGTIYVRIFGRYGPGRSLCEIELLNA